MENGPPCRRCAERNLSCVLNRSLQTLLDEQSQFKEDIVHDLEAIHASLQQLSDKGILSELPALRSLAHAIPDPPAPDPPEMEMGPSCDNSPKLSPQDEGLAHAPIQSVYYLTKLRALRSDVEARPTTSGEEPINDFIANGQLPLQAAERLFQLYYNRLDHFIYRVGGQYSTLDSLRRSSATLTACICTVAAMHDPASNHLYSICKKEFRKQIAQTMFDGHVDRDCLRALSVGAYWLSDMSWMLSGIAVRRATQINLSAQFRALQSTGPSSTTTTSSSSSSEALDLIRLWYISYVSDSHLSILYGRAPMVRDDVAVQRLDEILALAPLTTEDDKRMVSQVSLLVIVRHIYDLFGPDTSAPIPAIYTTQIATFGRQLDAWLGRWSSALARNASIGDFPARGVLIHFHFAKLYLHSYVFRGVESAAQMPPAFLGSGAAAAEAATSIVELLLGDPDLSDALNGMPSYLLSMTCFACVFLLKLTTAPARELRLVQREVVARLTGQLVGRFRETPVGKWHLVHLMADGLEKLAATLLGEGPEQQAAVNGAGAAGMPGTGLGVVDVLGHGDGQGLGRQTGLLGGTSPFFNFDMDFNYDSLSLLQ
ncbi:Transcription factor fungi [Macrophomina phaseolina MS6]|uniref:Transcription factor fungi n=1 Tax=Macrophomina phaseolina (strain MS6) TaxID=1126212 RepID=K2S7M2_MACPH|nr:Transcription factor fungi [Macrophomina phaseolina MS6]